MIGLIGKKIGMTQVFDNDGVPVSTTIIQAGPCEVVQKKTIENDNYEAVQLGYEKIEEKKLNKPRKGHFDKHKSSYYRYLKEFRLYMYHDLKEGEQYDVSMFVENELITIQGTSKGKGFQGVMKRHGFAGFQMSHGVHESYRGPGAIGQCADPARVFKGTKLPGQTGNKRITVKNLRIVKVDLENNLLFVKGGIPGSKNSIVYIKKEQ